MLLPWRDSSPNGLRGQGPIDPASDLPYLSPNHMGIRTCPRCSQPLHQGHSACPVCDFSLADVDSTFGSKRVRLQRIVAASSTISDVKAEWLNEKMDRFELEDYPQLLHQGPEIVAQKVVERFGKDHDDATCLVVRRVS